MTGLLTQHTLYLHLYRSDHLIILPSRNLKYYSSVELFICSFELLAAAIGTQPVLAEVLGTYTVLIYPVSEILQFLVQMNIKIVQLNPRIVQMHTFFQG